MCCRLLADLVVNVAELLDEPRDIRTGRLRLLGPDGPEEEESESDSRESLVE